MEFGIPGNKLFQAAAIHFILISSALMTARPAAEAYEFYNLLFFVSLFWSIHSRNSVEAVNTAYAINFACLFYDIAVTYFYISATGAEKINEWSIVCVILNMIFRVFSLKQIYEEIVKRGGDDDTERAGLV